MWGCPVHLWILSSIPGLYSLGATNSYLLPQSFICDKQEYPQGIENYPLGDKILLDWKPLLWCQEQPWGGSPHLPQGWNPLQSSLRSCHPPLSSSGGQWWHRLSVPWESDLILVLWGHRTGNQRSQLIWGSRNPREVSDLPCDCIFFEHNLTNIAPTHMSWIWSLKLNSSISSFQFHLLLEKNQFLVQEPVSFKVLWAFNVFYI